MSRIMIVDGYPIIRKAIRLKLEAEGHEVVAEADNGLDALALHRDTQPDLVILELSIPKLGGLDVIRRLKMHDKTLKVLVYSSQDTGHFAGRCLQAGAQGFVSKHDDLQELRSAARAVLHGRSYFPREALEVHDPAHAEEDGSEVLHQLSARELTVLQYLAQGFSNQSIAQQLAISFKTVSTYKARLMQKLHASSLVELAEIARRNSLLEGKESAPEPHPEQFQAMEGELQLLRSMIQSMPVQMHVCDGDGRLLFCNQAFCAFIGLSLAEMQGRCVMDLGWLPAADVEGFKARYLRAIERAEPYTIDLELQSHEQRRVLQHWGMPYRGSKGQLLGMICGGLDITERENLLLELSGAKEQAVAANRSKGAFLTAIGREFSAPLNVVGGMLDLAGEDSGLSVRGQEALHIAREANGTLLRLIGDLRDLVSLESGRLMLESEPTDLRALTEQGVERYAAKASKKGLTLTCSVAVAAEVWLDPHRYLQILNNLLSNALKFTDHGGVEVSLQATPCGKAQVEVQLVVSDSGIGIASVELPMLFEPFALPLDMERISRGGSGLGLALCRRLADCMGGSLELESQLGKGTRAGLRLRVPQACAKTR
ncbi:ATP-binding protein [Pseudomonas cavernicola]|uniref:ATP-binding protein n=1 Tax=Pseudomonas cavernicola TaxID=2320866 RepID=UPI001EE5A3C3|nr:ATP-binding protein [Pseudomonas cavernicola]